MTFEWKSDGPWLELFVDGKIFGCIRSGFKRKGQYFVAKYGCSSTERMSQEAAMQHLEGWAKREREANEHS